MARFSRRQAAQSNISIITRLQTWLISHAQVLLASLGRLSRAPLSNLLTAAVIGIALALPTGLHVVLDNIQQLSQGWDGSAQISLFLKDSVSDKEAISLARRLSLRPEVEESNAITRTQALEEFQRFSGFGQALEALTENPLPAVVVIKPTQTHSQPEKIEQLVASLDQQIEVDFAQLDVQWVKRLYSIMEIARRGVLVVAALLALAVLLVIGNTIRLDIQNRRDEIVIGKLVGATNAFIRRPFLYSGIWYGLTGGIIAWAMIGLSLLIIREPVERLASLYQSGFQLQGLDFSATLTLLFLASLLGLAGSWLSVGRHLSSIEPT